MRLLLRSSVIHFFFTSNNSINSLASFLESFPFPKPINMYKLVVLACVIAAANAVAIGVPGYGLITGLTKLPNLGHGNIANVISNQNVHGYQLNNVETGPHSVRSHLQSQIVPLGHGLPVGGLGLGGIGLGGVGLGGLGGIGLIG